MFLFWIFPHVFSLPLIGHLHLLSTKQSNKLHSGLKVKPSWALNNLARIGDLIQPKNCNNSNSNIRWNHPEQPCKPWGFDSTKKLWQLKLSVEQTLFPRRGFGTRVAPHQQKPFSEANILFPNLWKVFIFRRSLGRYTRHGCLGSPWFGCTAQVCSWSLIFGFFTINIYISDILILRVLVIFRSTYHSTVECTAQVCCWCCSGTTGVGWVEI